MPAVVRPGGIRVTSMTVEFIDAYYSKKIRLLFYTVLHSKACNNVAINERCDFTCKENGTHNML